MRSVTVARFFNRLTLVDASQLPRQNRKISRQSSTLNGASGLRPIDLKKRRTESNRGGSVPVSSIRGEVLDLAVDLRKARPGDKLEIPYELTVSEAMHDFWQSAFHGQDRISTSRPFCRSIGLQDRVLPFPLVLFLTSSMTHADAAKVQVGFENVTYHWPCFAGDTFTKNFLVKSVRTTSDGNHSVIKFYCELVNHRGRVCMSADKQMLFEFPITGGSSNVSSVGRMEQDSENNQLFRDHLLSKSMTLAELGSQSLKALRPGQLIFHTMYRSITLAQSMQLASLARLTHERHFDLRKYSVDTEILCPGGLVVGLTTSASSRDLHEILHEELLNVTFVNALHPNNVVGAMSYVQSVDDTIPGDLEMLLVRTIGVKNVDLVRDLGDGAHLPLELFTRTKMTTKEIERICKEHCPKLSNKIIVQMDRRIIRQSSHKDVFLL
eukprot:CAMPEP_0198284148 /NCGR_PEP_ID=MMETSP1449-20131203/3646_1 /TAXON_ID=420275 /ORGANISM="Attheya septentrionalis, Strain CCMP2084" /LENGTH=437 /DNA_ID=CAMNT_0043981085 /DNA_START=106 /DNA_END=1419 /DNA_ORIENTATION=+